MPVSSGAEPAQSISAPPPNAAEISAMTAKVGVAARHKRFIAGRPSIMALSFRLFGGALAIFVVALGPGAGLVAALRRAVEPLIHGPEIVYSSRIGGIGVVDDSVFAHECAHA